MDKERRYDIRVSEGAMHFELVAEVFKEGDIVTFPNFYRVQDFQDHLSRQNDEYTAYLDPSAPGADYTLAAEPSTHETR